MTSRVALVLEDEALIALDICLTLSDAGYETVDFASCDLATNWLEANPLPAVAVLDVHLRDGSCHAIATTLRNYGVPFVVHAGDRLILPDDEVFTAGVLFPKPSSGEALVEAVSRAASGYSALAKRDGFLGL